MKNWKRFVIVADEFLATYLMSPPGPVVALFLVGHAAELYLKAALTKASNDIDRAVGLGHNIAELLQVCSEEDADFPERYCLKQHILDVVRRTRGIGTSAHLQDEDREHFLRNQELYMIACSLADLKYLGTPMRRPLSVLGVMVPNSYWIDFFRDIRRYLGYPGSSDVDYVRFVLENKQITDDARAWLTALLGDESPGGRRGYLSVTIAPHPSSTGKPRSGKEVNKG